MINLTECLIKTNHIAFFGRIYINQGVFPDPKKFEDIWNISTPQDKLEANTEVWRQLNLN